MTVVPPPSQLSGQLVAGRYRVGEVIGRGAMSEVCRAWDERLDRAVALKVLRADCTDPGRFAEETSLLCALDHPNLVRLHDAGTHGGVPYLVLNLLEGTLADQLATAGALAPEQVARIGGEIAAALGYLHEHGVVHRDVKPSNVLLRADGSACLADLGAALSVDGQRLTATGLTVGTPRYLAPEQATGEAVTAATDVYSLGLVLLEAATGTHPFAGTQQESLAARVTRSPVVPAALPAALRGVLAPMVAVDPLARPTAAAVGPELVRLSLDPGLRAEPEDDRTTAVLAAPTTVGPILGAGGDTEVLEPAPRADETAGSGWVAARRDRLAWWALAGVVLIALLIGLASTQGFDGAGEMDPSPTTVPTTTPTTVALTTVPPTTAPAAPAVQDPGGHDPGPKPKGKKPKGR